MKEPGREPMGDPIDLEERKFESFFREFEPRRPRPLPLSGGAWRRWPRFAAAAALLVAAGGSALWVAHRNAQNNRPGAASEHAARAVVVDRAPVSNVTLTRWALDDKEEFDLEMNAMAQRSLPGFERKDSTLRVLAKE